ncbi:MAG: hypothetical protein JW776_13125 [Candidatus Lokiarchaeota archaeon]|nr:hypothetical protein [Candidatus Lokiarchaeota archaeon]
MALRREDVEKHVKWTGDGRIVFVKSKEDYMKVRNGSPTPQFWDLWREKKDEIKALGIYVKKEEDEEKETYNWVVTAWSEPQDDEKENAKKQWQKNMSDKRQDQDEDESNFE